MGKVNLITIKEFSNGMETQTYFRGYDKYICRIPDNYVVNKPFEAIYGKVTTCGHVFGAWSDTFVIDNQGRLFEQSGDNAFSHVYSREQYFREAKKTSKSL